MKDVLALHPVWHRVDKRVPAHVLEASLVMEFDRILQCKLEEAGTQLLRSRPAWSALEAVTLVAFELPVRECRAGVYVNGRETGQGSEAHKVLQARGARSPAGPIGAKSRCWQALGNNADSLSFQFNDLQATMSNMD